MEKIIQIIKDSGDKLKKSYISFSSNDNETAIKLGSIKRDIELYLRDNLLQDDNEIGILGKYIKNNNNASKRWIIDSLNGAENFMFGVPHFCISAAMEKDARIVMAFVYNPLIEEMFFAFREKDGAYCNDIRIKVSKKSNIKDSFLVLGSSIDMKKLDTYHKEWSGIFEQTNTTLCLLAPALNLCNLAMGRIDVFIDKEVNTEGQAAGGFILQKAGGRIDNYDGSMWNYKSMGIIASNGRILT
jgi:myo-inositol-1(or 4)-monophosphatase